MNEKKKGILILGFSGIGKTTLGQKYENVAEIGQSLFKNIYDNKAAYTLNREQRKNIRDGVHPNPDWPNNYIEKLLELTNDHDIVLAFTDEELMKALRERKIPFLIALPEKSQKEIFIERFKKRGQDEIFCKEAAQEWDEKLEELLRANEEKIMIPPKKFLEDVLKEKGYLT